MVEFCDFEYIISFSPSVSAMIDKSFLGDRNASDLFKKILL